MTESTPTDSIAYVPAIHKGYVDFFNRHPQTAIGVLEYEALDDIEYLKKDANALEPGQAAEMLRGYYGERVVHSLGHSALKLILADAERQIIMPDDDISEHILQKHEPINANVELYPVFLRWDRKNTLQAEDVNNVETITIGSLNQKVAERLVQESAKAANMWRRVGAVLFEGEDVIDGAHNESLPTPYTQTIEGDPRNTLNRGVGIEYSNDHHAEAKIIARAARLGRKLEGLDMVVSTFPCPVCAKDIAEAGIARLYFAEGYAVLDGRRVLDAAGVRLVKLDGFEELRSGPEWRDYPPS